MQLLPHNYSGLTIRSSRSHRKSPQSHQYYNDEPIRIRIFPDLSGTFRIYPDASGSIRMFPDVSGSFRIFPDVSGSFRIFPDVSGCFRILPDLSGHPDPDPVLGGEFGDQITRRPVPLAVYPFQILWNLFRSSGSPIEYPSIRFDLSDGYPT